jgi:hypothetical protein
MKNSALNLFLLASGFTAFYAYPTAHVNFMINIDGEVFSKIVVLREGKSKKIQLTDQFSLEVKNVEETEQDALFIYEITEKDLGIISSPTIKANWGEEARIEIATQENSVELTMVATEVHRKAKKNQ